MTPTPTTKPTHPPQPTQKEGYNFYVHSPGDIDIRRILREAPPGTPAILVNVPHPRTDDTKPSLLVLLHTKILRYTPYQLPTHESWGIYVAGQTINAQWGSDEVRVTGSRHQYINVEDFGYRVAQVDSATKSMVELDIHTLIRALANRTEVRVSYPR